MGLHPADGQGWAVLAEEVAGVGYWQLDVASQAIQWSPSLFKLYGLPVGHEPDLRGALAAVHPNDMALTVTQLETAIREGTDYSNQIRLRHTDGSWRTVRSRTICQRNATGKVVTILGVCLDITDVVQTNEALVRSEERYRLLVDRSQDIIVRADMQANIRYVSPSCRLLGYEPHELVGVSGTSLVSGDRSNVHQS